MPRQPTIRQKASRTAIWFAAAVAGASATLVHGDLRKRRSAMPDDVEVLYVPHANALRPMSLGFFEALADLLWVRALVFSGKSIGNTDIRAVARYAHAISGLAPRFHRVYQWGGVTAVYGGGSTVTREMVDISIDVYRRGLEQFPESHTLLYGLGMMLTHQVGSTPGYRAHERREAEAEGIALIRRAAAFGADPLVRQYAATLVAEHATSALAQQFLEAELATAESEDYRRMLRKKLRDLGAGASAESVERARTAFTQERSEQAAYVPDTLFALIKDTAAAPAAHPAGAAG